MYFWGGKGYAEIKARNWALKLLFGYAAAIIIVIIPFDVFFTIIFPIFSHSGQPRDVLQLQQPRGLPLQGLVQLDGPAGEEGLRGMLRQDGAGHRNR